jgi:hypothetical protein
MERVIDTLIYNFQDRFKSLKDIQKRAGDVPEAMDAALAEERYSGKVRSRVDDFEDELRDPLIKAIHESGVSYDDVQEFLHARHAPSRNKAMREINPSKQELKDKTDSPTAGAGRWPLMPRCCAMMQSFVSPLHHQSRSIGLPGGCGQYPQWLTGVPQYSRQGRKRP